MNIDKTISELILQIKQQKSSIMSADVLKRSKWFTNCVFNNVNIQTASVATIMEMAISLVTRRSALLEVSNLLGIEYTDIFYGYTFTQWISDFKKRISIIEDTEKRNKLQELEERLDRLVSPEQKRQMELYSIIGELHNIRDKV